MRFTFFSVCLVFSLFLAGCGTSPERRLAAPSVRVWSLDSGTLALRIYNPNTAPLVVTRSSHVLYLAGERAGRIDDPRAIGVPPLAAVTHTIALPASVGAKVKDGLAASVESSFTLAVGADDTMTLKTVATGAAGPAQ